MWHSGPQFQFVAYPMTIPNPYDFNAVYHAGPGGAPQGPVMGSHMDPALYYEQHPKGMMAHQGYTGKHFSRKESTDSGIALSGTSSRKTSTTSSINASIAEEPSEDPIKEETPFEEPDEELCEKITQQVEFYFSDANITKDKFLLKHVKRNKEGFVSLKLISSFKRVKHLTKDWRQVAFAIKQCSKLLEVNDLETKVRRLSELPAYDETTPSRTVVILNLPMERPTIEGVAEIFAACGEIVLVRILRPGNPIPADIKQYVAKHPEMQTKVCALVEYQLTEYAQKAVRDLNEEEEEKMKVMELTATPLKNGNKKIEARKLAEKQAAMQAKVGPQRKYSLQNNFTQSMMAGGLQPRTRRISLMPNMKFAPIDELKENVVPGTPGLNPNAPSFQMNADGSFQMIPPMNQRRISKPVFYASEGPQYVGMPGRRVNGFNNNYGSESAAAGLKLPPNVLRMPKGPESQGKGFLRNPKRVSKAIPIVAPPADDNIVTLSESLEGSEVSSVSSSPLQIPDINVEAASEDEAIVVADKVESCDSGHEEDSCSEPDASSGHDFEIEDTNERTR